MNKTVTINLSGIVFHIDENAYDTLKKYLESIRSKFTVADGRDEIVQDIEARIAEMFQQRLSDSKQAILPEDVNAVITILGKPEDIGEAQETASATGPVADDTVYHVKKRFFRSPDDKILGGVCGGISAYFDIDPIWLRLAFALAFFFGGSGILIYIILWVIVPMAKTPSEKLQMRGDDVTLSGIQKSVQDELENVKSRAGEMVNEVRKHKYGHHLGDFITDVVKLFFKFLGKIFNVVFILVSLVILFALTVVFALAFHHPSPMALAVPHVHIFWGVTGLFLLLGVPAVLLLLAGIKGLFNTSWKLRRAAGILAGLMLTGVGICLITGINISRHFASDAAITQTVAWQEPHGKILRVALNTKQHPYFFEFGFTKSVVKYGNGSSRGFSVESGNNDSIIPADVELYIEQSNNDSVQLVTNYYSRGGSSSEARSLARKIKYNFAYSDTTLNLDPYGSLEEDKIWRAQKVKLILKVPLNTSIRFAKNPNNYNYDFSIDADNDLSSDDFFGHTFTMTPDGLKCVDCNNDNTDDDNTSLNGNGQSQHEQAEANTGNDTAKSYTARALNYLRPGKFINYLQATLKPADTFNCDDTLGNLKQDENGQLVFH